MYEELNEATCFFRTSHTSGKIQKYYLLLKDSVFIFYIYFFQFFFTLWFFLTNFENSIFHKIPSAAALRLRPQLRLGFLAARRYGTDTLSFCQLFTLAKRKNSEIVPSNKNRGRKIMASTHSTVKEGFVYTNNFNIINLNHGHSMMYTMFVP